MLTLRVVRFVPSGRWWISTGMIFFGLSAHVLLASVTSHTQALRLSGWAWFLDHPLRTVHSGIGYAA